MAFFTRGERLEWTRKDFLTDSEAVRDAKARLKEGESVKVYATVSGQLEGRSVCEIKRRSAHQRRQPRQDHRAGNHGSCLDRAPALSARREKGGRQMNTQPMNLYIIHITYADGREAFRQVEAASYNKAIAAFEADKAVAAYRLAHSCCLSFRKYCDVWNAGYDQQTKGT